MSRPSKSTQPTPTPPSVTESSNSLTTQDNSPSAHTVEELTEMLLQRDQLLNTIASELIGSQDFICTYMRLMCVLHDGQIDLADLATRYGFNMTKLGALSAAGNHFAARGMIKRGTSPDKFSI